MKKKIFELRPWRSFSPGIGSARSAPMNNNDDIPTTDTNEIKQLINRVKRGELDQGDALLIEKLLNILLMIVSLLQRKHTSIRRMKELLLGMKEKKRGKDETKNRAEDRREPIGEIKKAFNAVLKDAGIEDFHFHDFRRTAATRLAEAGADAYLIAEILGHSNVQMSCRYTHMTDERKRQALDTLHGYVENPRHK